jgi:PTS system ascorbate-specific IIA component
MIGILLITHGDIGKELLRTAQSILKTFPTAADYLRVEYTFDINQAKKQALAKIKFLDEGDGVLILTDLFGATPHNISISLRNTHSCVISGLNLPMLLRSFNYAHLSLKELSEKAAEGGHYGITCSLSDKKKKNQSSTIKSIETLKPLEPLKALKPLESLEPLKINIPIKEMKEMNQTTKIKESNDHA